MAPHAMTAITRQTQPDDVMDYTWDAFGCLDHDVSPIFQENDSDILDTASWAGEVFQQNSPSVIVQNEAYDPTKNLFLWKLFPKSSANAWSGDSPSKVAMFPAMQAGSWIGSSNDSIFRPRYWTVLFENVNKKSYKLPSVECPDAEK